MIANRTFRLFAAIAAAAVTLTLMQFVVSLAAPRQDQRAPVQAATTPQAPAPQVVAVPDSYRVTALESRQ